VRDNLGMRTPTLVLTLSLLAACAAAAAPSSPMRVLVTNDDGVAAPGIDALVQQLAANPNLQVTVIAPATNQSGTGDTFTTTPIDVTPSSTAGAFPAKAVAGRPADSVLFGVLEALPQRPDLVVSGINFGQNAGEVVNISGTVGAALWAARLGIPAIAVSHGLFGSAAQYTESANYAAGLVERFRQSRGFRAKMSSRSGARFALVLNVNFPDCTSGATRGVVLVPTGRTSQVTGYTLSGSMGSTQTFTPTVAAVPYPFTSNCVSAVTDPATDIDGLINGFATLTPLNPDLTVSQKIRGFRFLLH
jgi:5'-nucleotidase